MRGRARHMQTGCAPQSPRHPPREAAHIEKNWRSEMEIKDNLLHDQCIDYKRSTVEESETE